MIIEDWTWKQAVVFLILFSILCGPIIYIVIKG